VPPSNTNAGRDLMSRLPHRPGTSLIKGSGVQPLVPRLRDAPGRHDPASPFNIHKAFGLPMDSSCRRGVGGSPET